MNTPVNFEIAKLLKEKGFDLPCRFLYKLEKGWEEGIGVDYNWNNFDSYSAPTIAEVIMWLYEKHRIWIWGKFQKRGTFVFVIENTMGENITISPDFNTPTEAYEAGIEYCLTKLIKVL